MTENGDATLQYRQPQRIGVSEARARWYELLRRAKAGEVFIITYRGVAKAELGPIPPDHPVMREWLASQQAKDTESPKDSP
ncbi:MAG: type II toxin-antitoxin system Phd/YefM family antitoxin [Chloroflexia bacterium]|jgi:prevent-host-death family protein|nr:type II toxin-antitoxin system Phd/YefM family antitoxin [Chloroflexia bacterium]